MTLVVDASVALKWFVIEPGTDAAETLLAGPEPLIAPQLVVGEICNAAWKLWRRGALAAIQTQRIASRIAGTFDRLVPLPGLASRSTALALELDHPAYDCFYLALAERERTVVVTADRRLVAKVAGTRFAGLARLLSDSAAP
jgi:predicted nucleic acid-binding protein